MRPAGERANRVVRRGRAFDHGAPDEPGAAGKREHAHTSAMWLRWTSAARGAWPRMSVSRSEEHTSELQSLMRISYAVFCLQQKTLDTNINSIHITNANYQNYSR